MFSQSKDQSAISKLNFSIFGETGETESVFTIAGRNFPVKVGAVGIRATMKPNENLELYSKIGLGYSQKQTSKILSTTFYVKTYYNSESLSESDLL